MSNQSKSSAARAIVGRILVPVLLIASLACDRKPKAEGADSSSEIASPLSVDSTRPRIGTGWEPDAGSFLILPTVDGGRDAGSIIRPEANDSTVGDTVGLRALSGDGQLELFSRGALLGTAKLGFEKGTPVDSGCTAWPVARLSAQVGQSKGWTAAFVKGKVTLVPLDSIEGLAPRDSAALAANISRLASSLSDDTIDTFRGLPFVVLRAYRGAVAGVPFVVTTLVRRVNQEDAPLEERLVMVIDGDQSNPSAWTVGWHERASGREDDLVVSEPLVAFQLASNKRTHLLFGRDDGEALSAAMLVHQGNAWKVLWESALAGCEH